MTKSDIDSLKEWLDAHGPKVTSLMYGVRLPIYEPITRENGKPLDYAWATNCVFVRLLDMSFYQRLKFLFNPSVFVDHSILTANSAGLRKNTEYKAVRKRKPR